MWYVYRMPGRFDGWDLARPMSEYLLPKPIDPDDEVDDEVMGSGSFPVDTSKVRQVVTDWAVVQAAAKRIKWDGSLLFNEPFIMPVATFTGLTHGFLFRQKSMGLTFVATPLPLEYLHEDIDYDARTDSDEMNRAVKAMKGQDPTARSPSQFNGRPTVWTISQNGNPTRVFWGGPRATVFASKRGPGYSAIVVCDQGRKMFTKTLHTEADVMHYVDAHIDDLVKECR